MARVTFDSLFNRLPDGGLEPRQKIRIGGVVIAPGVHFSQGAIFGGIDLTQYLGHDFEIDVDDDVVVLKSIYAKQPIE